MNKKSMFVFKLYGKLLRYRKNITLRRKKFLLQVKDGMIYIDDRYILSNLRITEDLKVIEVNSFDDSAILEGLKGMDIVTIFEHFIESGLLVIKNNRLVEPKK